MTSATPPASISPRYDPARLPTDLAALLADDLREFLAAPHTSPRYALIDALQCPPDHVFALAEEYGLNFAPLFLRTSEAAYHRKGPFLLELPDGPLPRNHPLPAALAATSALKQALTLAESPLPLPELSAHLRAWLEAELDDGIKILLRWFDARIGITLLNLLPAGLRENFLAPFRYWQTWDWNYRPCRLAGPKKPGPVDIPEPIRIDEAILRAFGESSVVQETIFHLEKEDPPRRPGIAPLPMLPALKHYIAERELETARKLGLTRTAEDRLALLWFAFHAHPGFWQDPVRHEKSRQRYEKNRSLAWLVDDPGFYDVAHRSGDTARALAEAGAALLAETRAARAEGTRRGVWPESWPA